MIKLTVAWVLGIGYGFMLTLNYEDIVFGRKRRPKAVVRVLMWAVLCILILMSMEGKLNGILRFV